MADAVLRHYRVIPAVVLGGETAAFARGGNRLCFVDPRAPGRCIKTLRADRSPAAKRAAAPWIKRLKPLSSFDDNLQEARVVQRIERRIGPQAFNLTPRLRGFVQTDLGPGLCSDLVRDDDGRISISLKQYLWTHGHTPALRQRLEEFRNQWVRLGMPSRRLLLHNIVVQCRHGMPYRLAVIDGLGWPDMLSLANWLPGLARRKARRKIRSLNAAIANLISKRAAHSDYGVHGWLEEERRQR